MRTFFNCRQLVENPLPLKRLVSQRKLSSRILNGKAQLMKYPPDLRRMVPDAEAPVYEICNDRRGPDTGLQSVCLGSRFYDLGQLLQLIMTQLGFFPSVRPLSQKAGYSSGSESSDPPLDGSHPHFADPCRFLHRGATPRKDDDPQTEGFVEPPLLLQRRSRVLKLRKMLRRQSHTDPGHRNTSLNVVGGQYQRPVKMSRTFWPIPLRGCIAGMSFAAYHIGTYPLSGVIMLLIAGLVFAVLFRLTSNLITLWPFAWAIGSSIGTLRGGMQFDWLRVKGYSIVLLIQLIFIGYPWWREGKKGAQSS